MHKKLDIIEITTRHTIYIQRDLPLLLGNNWRLYIQLQISFFLQSDISLRPSNTSRPEMAKKAIVNLKNFKAE